MTKEEKQFGKNVSTYLRLLAQNIQQGTMECKHFRVERPDLGNDDFSRLTVEFVKLDTA